LKDLVLAFVVPPALDNDLLDEVSHWLRN
jgi:hypothetical protein